MKRRGYASYAKPLSLQRCSLHPAAMSWGRGVCSKVCSIAQQHKERLESEHQHAKAVEERQRGHATAVTRQRLFRAKAKFICADWVTLESSGYAARQRQEELNVHFYSPWTWFKLKTGFFVLGLYKTKQKQNEWIGSYLMMHDAASKMSVKMAYRMRMKLYLQHADTVFFPSEILLRLYFILI